MLPLGARIRNVGVKADPVDGLENVTAFDEVLDISVTPVSCPLLSVIPPILLDPVPVVILLALSVTPPMLFDPLAVIAPHPSVPMPDTLPDAPIVIVFRVVTPDTAPLLIITPLIVFVVVGAVIAPHPSVPMLDTLQPDNTIVLSRVAPVI